MENAKSPIVLARGLAWAWILLVSLLLIFVLLGVVRPFFFVPLGDYPEQTVIAPRNAAGIPVVHLSEGVVKVHGTKCVNGSEPVITTGVTQWLRESENARTIIAGTAGVGKRMPGCTSFEFTNIMPSRMTPGVWQINGSEAAQGEGIFTGVSQTKTWQTEWFIVEP